jgi:uncharacterized protein (DUF2062 family)
MALGFFFGLLVPLAQIPLSAAAAVTLRANVPAAVASTLVTNPVTFGPLYYAAWRLGRPVPRPPLLTTTADHHCCQFGAPLGRQRCPQCPRSRMMACATIMSLTAHWLSIDA